MRVFLLISIVLLAGCGQSGDLYLPPKEQPAPAESTPGQPPPAEQPPPTQAEEKKDKK